MMEKQGTFIKKQFNKLVFGGVWGALAYAINLMTDSIISGNQLGETALEAVTIVYPLYAVVGLFALLIPLGISVMYGKFIGEFKEKEAYRVSGTGIVTTILICIFLALGLWAIQTPFLNYYHCTGELLEQAIIYYNWTILYALIEPIADYLYWVDITDGESALFTLAEVGGIIVNVVLSFLLSRIYGIAGLGSATVLYSVFGVVCYAAHFLKKSNNIHFHLCLDFNIIKRAVVLSFSEYMYYLFAAIVDIVLNSIIISYCGMEYIAAYSVVNLIFSICEVYIVFVNSSMGFVTCFLGEENNHDMNLLFKNISSSVLIISLALTVLVFFSAPLIPIIYGLETPVTINASIMATRIMSFTTLGYGTIYVLGSISSDVEKPAQSCLISFLNDVFSPLLLSLLFGMKWGFMGIVIGMSLSSYLSLILYTLISLIRKGKKGFPIYVDDFNHPASSFDLYVTPQSLVELSNRVTLDLKEHGYCIKNIDILIEEMFVRIMEKNTKKNVLAECTLLYLEDEVHIIIRDDGTLFNFIDENNKVESLNAYVLNSLLENTRKKNYVLTTSFNRNGFVFKKDNLLNEM